MDVFPANSHSSKIVTQPTTREAVEEKKVEKVVTGTVIQRKTPLSKKFMSTFFGGDAKGVIGYVFQEVLLPAAKDTITDVVSQGIERMVYGESRSTSRRTGHRPSGYAGYTSYNRYSGPAAARPDPRQKPGPSQKARANHDFGEIILPTRAEATDVIDSCFDLIAKYEVVTVADVWTLCGATPQFTDENWGWTDIRGFGVTRITNGYLLDLPKPEPLD